MNLHGEKLLPSDWCHMDRFLRCYNTEVQVSKFWCFSKFVVNSKKWLRQVLQWWQQFCLKFSHLSTKIKVVLFYVSPLVFNPLQCIYSVHFVCDKILILNPEIHGKEPAVQSCSKKELFEKFLENIQVNPCDGVQFA